jgi:outer membrane lipoprotein-sorting protein
MKKKMILLFFLCLNYCLSAEEFTAVEDENRFRQQYKSVSEGIKTLEVDFLQEKEIILLTNKLHSTGRMIFRNDNCLKIEYFKPNAFIVAIHNGKITIKDGERAASSTIVKNNKLFEQISQITMYAINGSILDSKNFGSTILENENLYRIILVPKSKELKKYYKTLDLYINKTTFMIEKTVMKETSGDETVMSFKNIRTNNSIPDEAFLVD